MTSGKVIVITGASGGIGAELAKQLGSAGNRLVLAARREAELREVAEQSGEAALPVVADVRLRDDVKTIRDQALEAFGQVDVWINNAGRGITCSVLDLTDEDLDEMVLVNLKSALYGMQAIIPHFKERGQGHLINVSTNLSRVPFATFRSAYAAAKAGLNMLTAQLRMDLRKEYPGIHVSLVLPGAVTTDFRANALGGQPQGMPSGGALQAQTAEEAAATIVNLIDNPQPEIYTNPVLTDILRRYYQDIESFEAGMQ
jgi:NAD(P)-dependent dehydrogenase (short-subunit alcohol dehydrogenase family)